MAAPPEARFMLVCVDTGGPDVGFEGDGGPDDSAEHRAGMVARLAACRAALAPCLEALDDHIAGVRLALHCRRERRRRPDVDDAIDHDHGLVAQLIVRGPRSRVPVLWQGLDRGDLPAVFAAALADEVAAAIEAAGSAWMLAVPRRCPVLLAPWPAALFAHECIGHPSEADNYLASARPSGNALGARLCRHPLRVVDDPTCPGLRGGYRHDDEGEPAAPTVLVEDGVWCGLLYNRALAGRLGSPCSGNGRRVPGAGPALPRMSVLRVEAGSDSIDELIGRIDGGVLCCGAFGGRSAGTDFVLRPAYGRWIEDGRLTDRIVRRFDLVGDQRAAVAAIAGRSPNVQMFDPIFGCDKDGHDCLPVSMGAPHLLLNDIELRPIERP